MLVLQLISKFRSVVMGPRFRGDHVTKAIASSHALKYAIWVVVASSRPSGDHNSPLWSP
jgi:hypothetical protein